MQIGVLLYIPTICNLDRGLQVWSTEAEIGEGFMKQLVVLCTITCTGKYIALDDTAKAAALAYGKYMECRPLHVCWLQANA